MPHKLKSKFAELIYLLETPTHWRMSPAILTFAEEFELRLGSCPHLKEFLTIESKAELLRLCTLLLNDRAKASDIIAWFRKLLGEHGH
ncbi:MAG: hypothetical protein H7235_07255 [Bdellovibrionaceae bacterium]|nr:hypothetical protein [Pseudobdellovibrionaceae bacterium]